MGRGHGEGTSLCERPSWQGDMPGLFPGRQDPGHVQRRCETLGCGHGEGETRTEAWRLLVVGDGSERGPFEQRLRAAGLRERAEFTGAVNFARMPEYFHRVDVMIIPTETTKRIREQFGRVIVEAMASGVPVIGSTCGAIPEVIGEAGLIFPEGDAAALAGALRRMLADEDLRKRLAIAGLARVGQYSWEQVAEKTYELYRQVLRGREKSVMNRSEQLSVPRSGKPKLARRFNAGTE